MHPQGLLFIDLKFETRVIDILVYARQGFTVVGKVNNGRGFADDGLGMIKLGQVDIRINPDVTKAARIKLSQKTYAIKPVKLSRKLSGGS